MSDHLAGATKDNGEGYQLGESNGVYAAELAKARIVTLSIGGNDLSFSTVVGLCVALPVDCGTVLSPGSVANLETNIANLGPVLTATYHQVMAAAPNAAVYVMGYPYEVPPQPSVIQQTIGCGYFLHDLDGGQAVSYLAAAEVNLNKTISQAAASAGVHYVDPNASAGSDSFVNHTGCAKSSWFNRLFHPSVTGQHHLAKDFEAAVTSNPTVSSKPKLSGVASIVSAGNGSSCAVLTSGGADCWGDNSNGQLGNGTNINSNVPVTVSGLSGVASITSSIFSAGISSYCAVLRSGGADCWGDNSNGQLGNGTNINSNVPVTVSGLSGVASIASAGDGSYCAVLTSGGADCWGDNSNGQLGNGTNINSNVPVTVSGLSGVASITSSSNGSYCAVLTSGGADCWGSNGIGQLGNGSSTDSNVPVTVSGLSGVASIASASGSYCAVLRSGGVDCWGDNFYGQLGNGTNTNSNVPVTVSGLSGVASITSSSNVSYCAVLTSGGADCWGFNLYYGELGNGTNINSNVPVTVSGLSGVASITSSADSSYCAVLRSGGVDCWGDNSNGQLGNGTSTNSNLPVTVSGLSGVASITSAITSSAYSSSYCAVLTSGGADCWGYNGNGQLGNGTVGGPDGVNDYDTPQAVVGLP